MSRDLTEDLPDGPLGEILLELRAIKQRLTAVEEKIDQRQLETKPIWERALAEISETRNEVQKLASDFREVKRNVRGLNDSLLNMVGELREMDERLARLESQLGTHQHT
jgi:chromosome segregation ATPase